jgi:hypothetical protein
MTRANAPLLGQSVRCALLSSVGPTLAGVLAFATRGCA